MRVTQIFFITKFVKTEQGRNDTQPISHKDNVGPSWLNTHVNFFNKMCDGIELRWLWPTSRNTVACKFGLPKIMHSIPTLPKHFLWGWARVFMNIINSIRVQSKMKKFWWKGWLVTPWNLGNSCNVSRWKCNNTYKYKTNAYLKTDEIAIVTPDYKRISMWSISTSIWFKKRSQKYSNDILQPQSTNHFNWTHVNIDEWWQNISCNILD